MSEITETGGETVTEQNENDGFNVESEVCLQQWVDFGYDGHSEYIHLIPDVENRELRCYRSIDETGKGNRRLKTVVENVSFSFNFDGERGEVKGFYLTWMEAKSFMTLLDLICHGREGHINVNWWEDSGKAMHEGIRTKEETLNFKFKKPNGVEREIQIASTWQTPTHKMANIKGEGFSQ